MTRSLHPLIPLCPHHLHVYSEHAVAQQVKSIHHHWGVGSNLLLSPINFSATDTGLSIGLPLNYHVPGGTSQFDIKFKFHILIIQLSKRDVCVHVCMYYLSPVT